ncbi:MAG: alpha/beta hydrolase [Theionarchaea archaeon]|nr:alpha/beta hydrolase [Theionarchaea archaeon]
MKEQNVNPGKNKVLFQSDGKKLAAFLFVPSDYKEGEKRPAVVITRPASGVKEQTAGLYAQKFSEKGFVAITFDPKGYGESEGKPQVEDPFSIISDTLNAVTFVESLPQVDKDNIFNAGVCMGAGYATAASTQDKRIKGTAAISPYLTIHIDYPKAYGGKSVVRIMMAFFKSFSFLLGLVGLDAYLPLVPIKSWMRLIPAIPVQHGMMLYYAPGTPGDVPNWKNKINLAKTDNFILRYNPFDFTSRFRDKPFFMAYADGGYSTDLLQKFYNDISVDDKELFVAKNATHFDLYYKPEFIDPIVEKVTAFFKKHINA